MSFMHPIFAGFTIQMVAASALLCHDHVPGSSLLTVAG